MIPKIPPKFKSFAEMVAYQKNNPNNGLCHVARCKKKAGFGRMGKKGWIQCCYDHREKLFEGD